MVHYRKMQKEIRRYNRKSKEEASSDFFNTVGGEYYKARSAGLTHEELKRVANRVINFTEYSIRQGEEQFTLKKGNKVIVDKIPQKYRNIFKYAKE